MGLFLNSIFDILFSVCWEKKISHCFIKCECVIFQVLKFSLSSLIYKKKKKKPLFELLFAEYTTENPKIITKCSHHFHLGCIYEWKERSKTCPVCGQVNFLSLVPFAFLVDSFFCLCIIIFHSLPSNLISLWCISQFLFIMDWQQRERSKATELCSMWAFLEHQLCRTELSLTKSSSSQAKFELGFMMHNKLELNRSKMFIS